jgi:hypothetical protein
MRAHFTPRFFRLHAGTNLSLNQEIRTPKIFLSYEATTSMSL